MKNKLLLLLKHGFHAHVLLFYRSSIHCVILGFVLVIRVISYMEDPMGTLYIVNKNLFCLENVKIPSRSSRPNELECRPT